MDTSPQAEKASSFYRTKFPTSTKVFSGVRFNVHSLRIPGKGSKTVQKDVIDHPGSCVILPFLDDKNIVMIRNERFIVEKTLLELPAGTLEPKESPLITAKRELEEESGFKAESMTSLLTFYPTPGICNEVMYSFTALGLTKTEQNLDESERITVEIVPFSKALQLIQKGIICDAKTITTLLYYHTFVSNHKY